MGIAYRDHFSTASMASLQDPRRLPPTLLLFPPGLLSPLPWPSSPTLTLALLPQRFSGQPKARCIETLLQVIHFPQPLSDGIRAAPISLHVQVAHEKEQVSCRPLVIQQTFTESFQCIRNFAWYWVYKVSDVLPRSSLFLGEL